VAYFLGHPVCAKRPVDIAYFLQICGLIQPNLNTSGLHAVDIIQQRV